MNLPRELLISKIQRNAREKWENESVHRVRWGGTAQSQRRVDSKEMQREEKEKGRKKEKNLASDSWYREQCEKNQCGSKNHLEILKEEACSAMLNLDFTVVKSEVLGKKKLARAASTAFSVFGPQNLLNLIMMLHHYELKNAFMKKARKNLLIKLKKKNSSCSTGRKKKIKEWGNDSDWHSGEATSNSHEDG